MERIIVYEGDEAVGLAKEFCLKHGLNIEMQDKLVLLLEQQIAGVLPRIVEGGEDEQEEMEEGEGEEVEEVEEMEVNHENGQSEVYGHTPSSTKEHEISLIDKQ